MLPWENLPVLRNQQVYRMPSVSSIRATLIKCCQDQQQVQKGGSPMKQGVPLSPSIPLIDPMDSYYLLNPSGDLSSTQCEFENWFRDQDFEVLLHFSPGLFFKKKKISMTRETRSRYPLGAHRIKSPLLCNRSQTTYER